MKVRRLLPLAVASVLLNCSGPTADGGGSPPTAGSGGRPTTADSSAVAGNAGETVGVAGDGVGQGGQPQAGASGGSGGTSSAGMAGASAAGGGSGGDSAGAGGVSGAAGGSAVGQFCEQATGATPTFTAVAAVDAKIPGAVGLIGNPEAPDTNYVPEHFTGNVRVVKAGKLLPDNLLHVDVVPNPDGKEQGLLSIVLSPDFVQNHLIYVQYSALQPRGQSRIDEFELSDATHATFVRRVYDQPHSHKWHNGGTLNFGPDKWLYVSIGDNNADCGPSCSQMDEGLYGRIRKLDVSAQDPNTTAKTFNKGLRNPWRWSFDPLTFDVVIGDVGDGGDASEKLFFAPKDTSANRNWGWAPGTLDNRKPEGTIATLASNGAIIGGRVYRGTNPKLAGACGLIFYGHLNGKVYTIHRDGSGNMQQQALSGVGDLASFGVDANGELYKTHLGGEVFRIEAK